MKLPLLLCAVLVAGITTASARVRSPSDDDKLQAACYPDVQRLCKDAIPDEAKITACMKAKKSQISKGCVEAYNTVERNKR